MTDTYQYLWQEKYVDDIKKMHWRELLSEVLTREQDRPSSSDPNAWWYVAVSQDLLITRIEEMEDELNAFRGLVKHEKTA